VVSPICRTRRADMEHPAPGQSLAIHSLKFRGTPLPYLGRKILVFLRLQTGLRCKIVITKEFPAKSSRIRSYGPFRPLPAEWRREEGVPGRLEGRLLRIIVHEVGK
jgi:hypothetical protein